MPIKEFLQHVWPTEGPYCLSISNPTGEGFINKTFNTMDVAVSFAISRAETKQHCFLCIGSLKNKDGIPTKNLKTGKEYFSKRCQKNIKALKSFILDLDCGEGKPYATQVDALTALKEFCTAYNLPKPTIVNSGYGVHVYFVLAAPIDPEIWKENAIKLKNIAKHFGLGVDNSRTADCSSLLRVVGTYNDKKKELRTVELKHKSEPIAFEALEVILDKNIKLYEIDIKKPQQKNPDYIKDIFKGKQSNIDVELPKPNIFKIGENCRQIKEQLDVKGEDAPYDLWRACLSIAKYSEPEDADYLVSEGYENFDEGAMNAQTDSISAPFYCVTFDSANPGLCDKCKHFGKINSPISLGYEKDDKELVAPEKPKEDKNKQKETFVLFNEVVELPKPPYPYERTEKGIINAASTGGDGSTFDDVIYHYDIYPFEIVEDQRDEGVFIAKIMIKLPHGRDKIVTLPFGIFADTKAFGKTIADAGVLTNSGEQGGMLISYMKAYINEIQKMIKPVNNYVQLGWQNDYEIFVLPDKSIHEDGQIEECGVSKNIRNSVKSFRKKGTIEEWKKVINTYNKGGYEPYAFGHLVGYASILFPFTQYAGAIVNMVGNSGSGKSTVLNTINSIFGHPEEPMLLQHDKYLAKIDRLGVFNSICVTYDEITNIDPEELSDLCYSVTQGRGRHRLNQNAEMKENNTSWKLLLASSSNANLMGKLSSLKHDASAESLRVFEYAVNTSDTMTKQEAGEIFSKLNENFGHAGEPFVNYVIQNRVKVRDLINTMMMKFDEEANVPTNERYWSAIVACVMAGGLIAKKLNLCDFDMVKIFKWSVNQVLLMRGVIKENMKDPRSLLVEFLNNHISNTIVIGGGINDKNTFVIEEPRAGLYIRNEIHRGVAYISKSAIKNWLVKGGSDYNTIRMALKDSKIILNDNSNKVLSKDSSITKTGQIATWMVNLNHPEMSGNVLVPKYKDIKDEDVRKVVDITSGK